MRVLLVEDSPADARLIREMLGEAPRHAFELGEVGEWGAALAALRDAAWDVLLLDLGLPDSQGLETLARAQEQVADRFPIIVLTGLRDEEAALEAVHRGAQDFLAKSSLSAELLTRALRYAVQRHRAQRALAESEERFRYFFDHSPFGKAITLPSGQMRVNRALCEILGYSQDQLSIRTWREITHPEDIESSARLIDSLFAGERDSARFTQRFIHKDGSIVWADVGMVSRRDKQGKTSHLMTGVIDITRRKQAEAELCKLNEELEKRVHDRTSQVEAVNCELEAFSYSVSHDLRAPLRHICGFVGRLKKTLGPTLPGQARHYLDQIADAADQMGRLIDDLLVFSRMGRTELRRGAVDLHRLVLDVIRELEPELKGRNVLWSTGPLPVVQADPPMLRQVMLNLLSNAIKYTRPRDPARIQVGSRPGSPGETVIFVCDNGVGFDMTYLDKLFGVFQRLHTDQEFEGTGIGLASVRRVIARHGGRTWAEGKPGQGATFYFSLPQPGPGGASLLPEPPGLLPPVVLLAWVLRVVQPF